MPALRQFRFFRTLRFGLASTFLVLLAVVLVFAGVAGTTTLRSVLADRSEQTLKDELGALKGYIHFGSSDGQPEWFADKSDPEENATVARLSDIFLLVDDQGRIDQLSNLPPSLTFLADTKVIRSNLEELRLAQQPIIQTVTGTDKVPYEIICSALLDSTHARRWYVMEGRPLQDDGQVLRTFRRNFFIFLPIALVVCALISWYSAGRALRALQYVERAAQDITGSSLGVQIPKRGADDELDRLIDSFNQMSRRLKASFEQIRQFSTDVSHELRTPLTAIQGQLEVALFTATNKEQLKEAIENALQDVERLSNLVRALLLLSQSESGQLPLHKSVLDLNKIIEDLVDQFQIPADACGLTVTQNSQEPVLCEADRTQIERLITNLLSNAIKYTPAGGWVTADAENGPSGVKLIIEDSGVGIPETHVPHIFDRFYRVPDPNPEKGLGLGLSFVASIVKAHGGAISVQSQVGKGSRFEVDLPRGSVRIGDLENLEKSSIAH
jgi:heavy metal sensor kinase